MTEADAVHMAQHFLEQARRAKLHDEDQFQGAVLSLSGLLRRAAREAVTPALVPEPTPVPAPAQRPWERFQQLWTATVDRPGYNKETWKQLEALLLEAGLGPSSHPPECSTNADEPWRARPRVENAVEPREPEPAPAPAPAESFNLLRAALQRGLQYLPPDTPQFVGPDGASVTITDVVRWLDEKDPRAEGLLQDVIGAVLAMFRARAAKKPT